MCGEELRDLLDPLRTNISTTATRLDIREDGDYKKCLLRRVKEMNLGPYVPRVNRFIERY